MNRTKFLKRISLEEVRLDADLDSLKKLQRKHLLNVPFENLDIHWNREIILDLDRFFEKIIENGRGGFCYELNGNFNELLKDLGFETEIISARVADQTGGFGEEYDHMAIVVTIDRDEYLADVGFGDFIAEPLKIDFEHEQHDPNGVYKILKSDDGYLEVLKKTDIGWKSEYIFKNVERKLNEFAAMCIHNQTSPESHFTKGKLCSMMTVGGWKTLTETKFIVTNNGKKDEIAVGSNNEFQAILKREFGISENDRNPVP